MLTDRHAPSGVTYAAPGIALTDDHLPEPGKNWFREVEDERVYLDLILLVAAVRNGVAGIRAAQLYFMGLGLKKYLTLHGVNLGSALPLGYVQAVMRPHLGKEHRSVWRLAEKWGVVVTWPEQNACQFVAHDRMFRSLMEGVLGFEPKDAKKRSVAQLLWVAHCDVRQKLKFLWNPKWSTAQAKAYVACLVMQALNKFNIEWSQKTMAKLLSVNPNTLTQYSKLSGEYIHKRAVLSSDGERVRNWNPDERHNGIKMSSARRKPMPDPKDPGTKGLLARLDATRETGGSSTKHFFYTDPKTGLIQVAKRIPNIHTHRLEDDRVLVRYSFRNLSWGTLSKLDSVSDTHRRGTDRGFKKNRIRRMVGRYHNRRREIQKAELRSKNFDGDRKSLCLSTINDDNLRKKLRNTDVVQYPLGDEVGEVNLTEHRCAPRPTQARTKGRTRQESGLCNSRVATSLRWPSPVLRRPLKCGRRRYAPTYSTTVEGFGGRTKKVIKKSGSKDQVVVLSRGKLKDYHARRPYYCRKCGAKLRSHPHPMYHTRCECGSRISEKTVTQKPVQTARRRPV